MSKAITKAAQPNIVERTAIRVNQMLQAGQLHIPANYSPDNALKAAWLNLQEVKDRNKKPALEVCTQASIANALLSMVVQGLDVNKKQGYFIVYGNHLAFQRSYFGNIALAKRGSEVADVFAQVRYESEAFKVAIERGRMIIERHEYDIDIDRDGDTPITHAYAVVSFTDGRPEVAEVMTWAEIQKAWSMSRAGGKTHQDFPAEMGRKTVINRALKRYVNSSMDTHLLGVLRDIQASDEIAAAQADLDEEYNTQANREPLQLEEHDEQTIDAETGEILDEQEPQAVPAASRADEQQLMDPGY